MHQMHFIPAMEPEKDKAFRDFTKAYEEACRLGQLLQLDILIRPKNFAGFYSVSRLTSLLLFADSLAMLVEKLVEKLLEKLLMSLMNSLLRPMFPWNLKCLFK